MKKPFVKVKDFAKLADIKKQINDALTGEKASELKTALSALITELDSSEVEVDEKAFAEQVGELIKKYMSDPDAEVPAAVANAIAKKIQSVKDSINTVAGDKLSLKVKNEIAREIIGGKNDKSTIKDSVAKILVANGVSGLEFGQTIDYMIATKWEGFEPIIREIEKNFCFEILLFNAVDERCSQLLQNSGIKQAAAGVEKTLQELNTSSKEITTAYVYVRQQK